MIDAIAFDWGGVFTIGTFDGRAVTNLASLYNVTEEVVAATYYPLMEEFEVGAFDFDGFYQHFSARSGLEVDPGLFRKTFLGSVKERRETFELLARIPPRCTVGMLSNNVPVLCDRVRNDPRLGRIEHFLFSNELGVRKPAPAAFEALQEALGRPREATVFVDDNADNIAAARAFGFQALLLDSFDGFLERWNALLPDLAVRPEDLARD